MIGLSIAKSIFGELLDKDREYYTKLIVQALKKLSYSHEIRISMSEDNYELVEPYLDKLKRETNTNKISLLVDNSLEDNDCMIESTGGYVDASYFEQIKKIENEIKILAGVKHSE